MVNTLKRLWNDESAQGLPEYALLVAAVVVMVVVATVLFRDSVTKLFDDIGTYIDNNNGLQSGSST